MPASQSVAHTAIVRLLGVHYRVELRITTAVPETDANGQENAPAVVPLATEMPLSPADPSDAITPVPQNPVIPTDPVLPEASTAARTTSGRRRRDTAPATEDDPVATKTRRIS